MADEFLTFYERPFRPLDKMSRSDLAEELQKWRNLWTWVDPDVQFWLTRVGQLIRVTQRNYQAFFGKVGMVHFDAKLLDLMVHTRDYDYAKGEATYETKDVTVRLTELVNYQFVYEQEVIDEEMHPVKEAEGDVEIPKEI